ncbi:MAG: polysaccharide deacetylase family protein, partial [candidate division Zixibacteria bacterium]|nr:polysaccharide deacetylase family protein [candidate division Zixibacteria bacterium]
MFFLAYAILFIIILFLSLYILWRIKFKKEPIKTIEILTYHKISDDFDWGITRQKVSQFERGIKFLHDLGYKAVPLEEIFKQTSGSINEGGQKVVITFDDGYENAYLNAFPILQKYGFTAFIFIITGFVGKPNSWDFNFGRKRKRHLSWKQIKEMSEFGLGFGSHTVNHPDLTKIDPACGGVEYELKKSKEVLEDKLGKEVIFLSYPFGRYNRFVQEEAQRLGYKRAYTLVPKSKEDGFQSRLWQDFQPFAVERTGIYLFDT